jgi:hypothetical protein
MGLAVGVGVEVSAAGVTLAPAFAEGDRTMVATVSMAITANAVTDTSSGCPHHRFLSSPNHPNARS